MESINLLPLAVGHMIGMGAIGSTAAVMGCGSGVAHAASPMAATSPTMRFMSLLRFIPRAS